MCCSVLQCIAVRCSVLQCVVEMVRVVSANGDVLQCKLQCVAVRCNNFVLHFNTHCDTTATHCNNQKSKTNLK